MHNLNLSFHKIHESFEKVLGVSTGIAFIHSGKGNLCPVLKCGEDDSSFSIPPDNYGINMPEKPKFIHFLKFISYLMDAYFSLDFLSFLNEFIVFYIVLVILPPVLSDWTHQISSDIYGGFCELYQSISQLLLPYLCQPYGRR